jgi:hypothetical protein
MARRTSRGGGQRREYSRVSHYTLTGKGLDVRARQCVPQELQHERYRRSPDRSMANQERPGPPAARAKGPARSATPSRTSCAVGARSGGLRPQTLVQGRLRSLEVGEHPKIVARDLAHVDLVDMHQAQQLAHWLGHRSSALIARAPALGHADTTPEFLLIESEAMSDFPRIGELVRGFHFAVISQN